MLTNFDKNVDYQQEPNWASMTQMHYERPARAASYSILSKQHNALNLISFHIIIFLWRG